MNRKIDTHSHRKSIPCIILFAHEISIFKMTESNLFSDTYVQTLFSLLHLCQTKSISTYTLPTFEQYQSIAHEMNTHMVGRNLRREFDALRLPRRDMSRREEFMSLYSNQPNFHKTPFGRHLNNICITTEYDWEVYLLHLKDSIGMRIITDVDWHINHLNNLIRQTYHTPHHHTELLITQHGEHTNIFKTYVQHNVPAHKIDSTRSLIGIHYEHFVRVIHHVLKNVCSRINDNHHKEIRLHEENLDKIEEYEEKIRKLETKNQILMEKNTHLTRCIDRILTKKKSKSKTNRDSKSLNW